MGQALSQLFNMFTNTKRGRILMLGLDGAGKTTVLYRMKLGEVVTTIPTIGFNVETVCHRNVEFTIWDVGGQDKVRQLWRHYFQGCQGLVFLIDSNDTDRLTLAASELKYLLSQDELLGASLLVLANKQDLPRAMSLRQIEDKLELHRIANHRPWMVQPCCAVTGEGMFEGFDWLAQNIK
eukprot:c9590_g1_i1.p1 GENE.c9590_g1_i1~~c9590_g1_i1.p1  ORF type:complete len:180 (+),score=35.83 c9590_g1_i1:130-669(+)